VEKRQNQKNGCGCGKKTPEILVEKPRKKKKKKGPRRQAFQKKTAEVDRRNHLQNKKLVKKRV